MQGNHCSSVPSLLCRNLFSASSHVTGNIITRGPSSPAAWGSGFQQAPSYNSTTSRFPTRPAHWRESATHLSHLLPRFLPHPDDDDDHQYERLMSQAPSACHPFPIILFGISRIPSAKTCFRRNQPSSQPSQLRPAPPRQTSSTGRHCRYTRATASASIPSNIVFHPRETIVNKPFKTPTSTAFPM